MIMIVLVFLSLLLSTYSLLDNETTTHIDNKFIMHLHNISRTISEKDIIDRLHGKTVNIKIGVYNSANTFTSFGNKHFWIEFDPLNKYTITNHSMLLPFIVTPDDNDYSNFYHCEMGACSSIYRPSGKFPTFKLPEMVDYMTTSCNKISDQNINIRLWDKPSNISHTVYFATSSSLACYNTSSYSRPLKHPSINLNSLLRWIPTTVNYLDIDAQGADLAILYSITNNLHKIRHIKVECQRRPLYYMYDSAIVNECDDIITFLQNRSFSLKELEVNNCGISEYNLYFTNIQKK